MSYTSALAQWAGSQCVHTQQLHNRPLAHVLPRKTLLQASQPTCRKASLRRHIAHATGTEIRDEDLQSAGNQEKVEDLAEIAQTDEMEEDMEVQQQMQHGEEAESREEARQAALAALQKKVEQPAPAQFGLNFLWLDKNIAVAVDQLFDQVKRSPVTEYFFWPRKDAWEELKDALEAKPWIQERDKIILLNKTTEIINFWQDAETAQKRTIGEAKAAFPDCMFQGSD